MDGITERSIREIGLHNGVSLLRQARDLLAKERALGVVPIVELAIDATQALAVSREGGRR